MNEVDIPALLDALEQARADVDKLLALIMDKTNLCPFGGGKDGKRVSCRYGHPGCTCSDWVAAFSEKFASASELEQARAENVQLREACEVALEWAAAFPLGCATTTPDREAAQRVYQQCNAAIRNREGEA